MLGFDFTQLKRNIPNLKLVMSMKIQSSLSETSVASASQSIRFAGRNRWMLRTNVEKLGIHGKIIPKLIPDPTLLQS
jgi:hypothetical protein